MMRKLNNGFSKKIGLTQLAKKSAVQRHFVWFLVFSSLLVIILSIVSELATWYLLKHYSFSVLFEVTAFMLAVPNLVVILGVFFIIKYREKRPISDIGLRKHQLISQYSYGFIQGSIYVCILSLVAYLLGAYQLSNDQITQDGYPIGFYAIPNILFILVGWAIQSACEEIVVRGWMLPLLAQRYNVPFAIMVTSLFFVALHLLNGGIDVIPIINLWLYGVFAALYVIRYQNLWGICGLHAAWNWTQANVFGMLVSGNDIPVGSLIVLSPQRETWLSGGAFGIEGSILTTILLVILCVYFIRSLIHQKVATLNY